MSCLHGRTRTGLLLSVLLGWQTLAMELVPSRAEDAPSTLVFAQQRMAPRRLPSGSRPMPCPVDQMPGAVQSPGPTVPNASAPEPRDPAAPVQPGAPAPPTDETAGAGADVASRFAATTAGPSVAANMQGDILGFAGDVTVRPSGRDLAVASAVTRSVTRFKIADNSSPLPQTRVFYNYNYFNSIFETDIDLHRNTAGVEVGFWSDLVSFEVRGSLDTFTGELRDTRFGNLVTAVKGLLWSDRQFSLSSGLAIGWPVGPRPDGNHNYLFSPFVGYLFANPCGRLFLQGFEQIDFPTDMDDQPLLHTDLGAGYWLRRYDAAERKIGIAPTIEFHLYTPLGNAPSGALEGLVYSDVLNMTLGTTFVLREQATFALGLALPLSSRNDYDFEVQAQFNWKF